MWCISVEQHGLALRNIAVAHTGFFFYKIKTMESFLSWFLVFPHIQNNDSNCQSSRAHLPLPHSLILLIPKIPETQPLQNGWLAAGLRGAGGRRVRGALSIAWGPLPRLLWCPYQWASNRQLCYSASLSFNPTNKLLSPGMVMRENRKRVWG